MADETSVHFRIIFKMSLVMGLVAIIPLAVMWYISHAACEGVVRQDVHNTLSSSADQLQSFIESWIDMNVLVLRQNAKFPEMISMDGVRQKKALETMVDTYEWDYLAFVTDINGQNISRSDSKELKDYSDRSYVRQVLGGKSMGQQVLISKTTGKPALVISVPIKDSEDKTKGVLAVGMTLAGISEKLSNTRFGKTGYVILLDQEGDVISHIDDTFIKNRTSLTDHPGYQAMLVSGKESLVYTNEFGKKVFSEIRKTKHDWVLLVQQDYDEAFSALTEYNQKTKIVVLISLISLVIIGFFVFRQLTAQFRS
jgi:methyl-accepting chemotaxis protein